MSAVELTIPQCTGLNGKLETAISENDTQGALDILSTLQASDARKKGALDALAKSKLSKTVNRLTKNEKPGVAQAASALVQEWRAVLKKNKEGGGAAAAAAPPPSQEAPESVPEPKAEPAAELAPPPAAAAAPPAIKAEASSSERKATELVMTGDSTRDMVLQKLHDVFKKEIVENAAKLRDNDHSAVSLAQECEEAMNNKYNGVTKEYKARFRSLMFNLQDQKNPEFRFAVVSGQTYIGGLADMDVKDMASGALKAERAKQHENAKMALMDKKSYEKYAGKEVLDGILKCPKCKSMKTEYTEVQTRSADEPTTKKCFCNTCNYRWKFC